MPNGNIVFFDIDGTTRTVTVTPVDGQIGSATITVSVSDGVNVTSTNFNFTVSASAPGTAIVNNASPMTIPNMAAANTYPSTLNVSGRDGEDHQVDPHAQRPDAHVVAGHGNAVGVADGPEGGALRACGGGAVNNVTVTLDDAAAYALPPSPFAILAGTYQPLDAAHDAFAVTGAGGTLWDDAWRLSTGCRPTAVWSLYVFDDPAGSGSGIISGGWSLAITTEWYRADDQRHPESSDDR